MLALDLSRTIIRHSFSHAYSLGLNPLGVAVLDAGGHVIAFERQDGASNLRFKMAFGKANGALAMGMGLRKLYQCAQEPPYFINAINTLADEALTPVPGSILIRNSDARILGAVGIIGDNSDNDERCAVYAVEQVGLVADPG